METLLPEDHSSKLLSSLLFPYSVLNQMSFLFQSKVWIHSLLTNTLYSIIKIGYKVYHIMQIILSGKGYLGIRRMLKLYL